MNNAWLIATRPFCNALNTSGNPICPSLVRLFAESLPSKRCMRSIYQASQNSPRPLDRRRWQHDKTSLGTWNFETTKSHYIYSQSAFRFFTTSPHTNARVRHAPRTASRHDRPSRPIPLWERYTPSAGVPLHNSPLSASTLSSVFGDVLTTEEGNLVLRRLQHRRLSGALAHESLDYIPTSSDNASELAEKGLRYLREKYPMDEQGRADRYAEIELKKVEKDALERGQRLGLYKLDEKQERKIQSRRTKWRSARRARHGQESSQDPIYGESVLERIRKANEARNREREAREEAAATAATAATARPAQETTTSNQALENASTTAIAEPGERPAWLEKWYQHAQLSSSTTPPEMSTLRRLGPSLLFFLLLTSACLLYATSYTPPARTARLFPNTPTALATISTLIGLNLLFLVAWRIPPCWRLLNRYFVLVPGQPQPWSLLGNVFSHQSLGHCALNMLMLALLGTRLHESVGRAPFLALYLTAGAAGGVASLSYYTLRRNWTTSSFGASGAVAGVLAAVCLLEPRPEMMPPGRRQEGEEEEGQKRKYGQAKGWLEALVPLPGVVLLVVMIGADIVGLRARRQSIDHVAHLGGYGAGIVGAWVFNRQTREGERGKEEGRSVVKDEKVATVVSPEGREGKIMATAKKT